MEQISRHQCLIYDGSPSRQLPSLAAMMRQKLSENYRCIFLNSPPMVAGMRSYLAAAGVDIAQETERGSLILSSERDHLANGQFDPDRMIAMLSDALAEARRDGYQGLWATGDMTWEFGPQKNFVKLFEYECLLEDFFRGHPALSGVCQYHADTLPHDALRQGLASHPAFFVNETLARINPHYLPRAAVAAGTHMSATLDRALERLLAPPPRHTG
jgi:hypothetical protein